MKKGFVPTENFKRLKEAEKLVAKRGALEAGLVLVRGVYGIGKSMLTERWATDSGYVFVRAKETWTKHTVLREIATKMGLSTHGAAAEVQDRIIGQLAVTMTPLIIDEADHLVDRRSASMLEVIRDITDITGIMCFLVGMEGFPVLVARHAHIASRVARIVELEPLSVQDVQTTVTAKAEVPMSADVVAIIHQHAKGRMRLVLNAIANIEQWAQANSWARVELDHIKGRPLCPEFTSQSAAASARGAR
ncbi:hypothetical protein SAMN05192589_107136 [Paracidovorax valerianellae]|uniref:ORC1/DEAH AAA+ ATPase domain-containing protein n=1 Tax=Paracidovorax valerianellae TaxID=187868 RepID=A0A1G6VVZ3_9BURK|nr:AAA family ATPase [Paracidovorax valerianellae]SDD56975.1 hypothetical protein SAMN05192589_107136 [Paracidovorax valerianellae]